MNDPSAVASTRETKPPAKNIRKIIKVGCTSTIDILTCNAVNRAAPPLDAIAYNAVNSAAPPLVKSQSSLTHKPSINSDIFRVKSIPSIQSSKVNTKK